jgi:hypothetical protein
MKDNPLNILRELAQLNPFYAGETGGDIYCFFCNEWQLDTKDPKHDENCLFVRAVELVGHHEIAERAANKLEEEGDVEGAEEIREEIQNHLVDVVE